MDSTTQITEAPPPWDCKATVYVLYFVASKPASGELPEIAYSPLERASPFASPQFGRALGGLSTIQLVRYSRTPVGPYDEMLLVPGKFEYPVDDKGKKRRAERALRLTRIYVSQKDTCWNGRKNWNIPKHLARFEWTDLPDGSTHVEVFPHDTATPYDKFERKPSDRPFFRATFQPMRYTPYFPMSTKLYEWLGIRISMVQPPLPEGESSQGELAGTTRWCKVVPYQYSKRSCVGWADMRQADEGGEEGSNRGHENFWPGLGRWVPALKMEDADVRFGDGEFWDTPQSLH